MPDITMCKGNGATLCHCCSKIINTGFTDDLYCSDKCKEKHDIREYYKQMDKEYHQNRVNLNKQA
jgi:predicted nucleic acid-binding Zn ribbon protein